MWSARDATWFFEDKWTQKLEIMRCSSKFCVAQVSIWAINRLSMPQSEHKSLLQCCISTTKSICWSFSGQWGRNQIATWGGKRWRTSRRYLPAASCRCNPYLKARNNGTQCVSYFAWGALCAYGSGLFESRDLVLQFQCCCKVQASLKRKGKRAICNATYSYF